MPNNPKKLTLSQETLRTLTSSELQEVRGGALTHVRTCESTFCCPTFTCAVPDESREIG